MANPLELPSLVAGTAIGGAAAAAFAPAIERPRQDAWAAAPNRLPEIGLLAALVAGGKIELKSAHNMAARLGYDTGPFDSMVWLAQNRLDFPLMLRLWRQFPNYTAPDGSTIDQLVNRTLAHEQLDWNYHGLVTNLQYAERPGIGDIAYSVVRGYLPTNLDLPVAPPSGSDYVPRFPQSNKLAEDLAKEIGFNENMLELMVARSGLSMAPVMAAQANFRTHAKEALDNLGPTPNLGDMGMSKQVGDQDYRLAISEGDLRTEWADAVKATSRQILTSDQYAELHLRGWITREERNVLASQHGMASGNSELLYQLKRRPLSPHQIKQALARGAKFDTANAPFDDPYLASVHEGDLGPEWYDMAIKLQGSYPPLFQVNRLVTAGIIDAATGADWMRKAGEADEVVTALEQYWQSQGGSKGDPHVTKAETQLWTATHKSYVGEMIDAPTATAAIEAAGVSATAAPQVINLWNHERNLIRKQLTPVQIRKAVATGVRNPDTGLPWTLAEAISALVARGYSTADAETFLAE